MHKAKFSTILYYVNLRSNLVFVSLLCVALRLHGQEPSATVPGADTTTETIVFLRHGEKPTAEYGQLNCQGLNRALALPKVLIENYGRADFIFAPDPAKKISKNGVDYSYTRALATIEPTAIELGLPVETKFGYKEVDLLEKELLAPRYERSLVFIAWEHLKLQQLVKNLVAALGNDPAVVPPWSNDDFDSIYVVRIWTVGSKRSITFQHDYEHLDGLSTDCPDWKTN